MHRHEADYAYQQSDKTRADQANSIMVELQTKEIIPHPQHSAEECVNLITTTNQQRYVILIPNPSSQEKGKSKWLKYIEKLTGWKIILFDSLPQLPLIILDKGNRELYINQDLLKLKWKEVMGVVDNLVALLTKQTAEAFQSVTNALQKIQFNRKERKTNSLILKITDEGLRFPADFSLEARDLRATVISVDSEIMIKTASFRMVATVTTDLPLTVETTKMHLDEQGFLLPLNTNLSEQLAGFTELPFTVEYIDK